MKRAPRLEKDTRRRFTPFKDVRTHTTRRPPRNEWLLLQEMDDGPDESFREAVERIERGEVIAGRAL